MGYRRLPPVSPMKLTEQQRQYVNTLGTLHVSNEMDWLPVDFSVGGDPSGYSVEIKEKDNNQHKIKMEKKTYKSEKKERRIKVKEEKVKSKKRRQKEKTE